MESLRIRPSPFLKQPERVMERIPRGETPRLGVFEGKRIRIPRKKSARLLSSDSPKGLWKGYQGRNPSIGGFRREKDKDTKGRIRPTPFLGQPEDTKEETPRLGVSEGIRIRIRIPGKNPPNSFPRTTRKGYGKDTKGRNPSIGGFRRDKDKDMNILNYGHHKI